MLRLEQAFPDDIAADAHAWFASWQLAPVAATVRIRFSPRMFRAIGRAAPYRRLVTFAVGVREMAPALVREVLAHELAHVAAYELHGAGIRPHGAEWAALMRAAGFVPRVRFADAEAIALVRARATLPVRYLHLCPVCAASRIAARRMPRWRCGACYARGRDGLLEITRVTA
jgi:SprT protein